MPATYPQWKYRGVISIQNPPTLDGYQCMVNIPWQPGMNPDFSDLRFSDVYGNPLPYWLETVTSGVSAGVWVKVPLGATMLYYYFGNRNANSESNPYNTFLLYDDFTGTTINTSKWSTFNNGWANPYQNNEIVISGSGTGGNYWYSRAGLQSLSPLPNGVEVTCTVRATYGTDGVMPFVELYNADNQALGGFARIDYDHTNTGIGLMMWEGGSSTEAHGQNGRSTDVGIASYTEDTYATLRLRYYNGSFTVIYNSNSLTRSYTLPTPFYLRLSAHERSTGGSATARYDNVIVRNYTPTEPTLTIINTGTNPAFLLLLFLLLRGALPVSAGGGAVTETVDAALGLLYGPSIVPASNLSGLVTSPGMRHGPTNISPVTMSLLVYSLGAKYGPSEQSGDIVVPSSTFIAKYPVSSIRVSKGVGDQMWQCDLEIEGAVSIGADAGIMITMRDHNGVERCVFVGILPVQSYSYDKARNMTTLTGYSYGYYLTRQYVPSSQLYAPASQDPATTIYNLLGGANWLCTTGLEPYRLKEYHSYDPNNLVWGDVSQPFKWAPKTSKRQAIADLEEATNYLFVEYWRQVGDTWRPCAFWVHSSQLDSSTEGLGLPAKATFTNPDPYLLGPVVILSKGDERYNKFTVEGFDEYGVRHSYTMQQTDVARGDTRPIEYYELGPYKSDYMCALRAQQLYNYYVWTPRVYSFRVHSRCDLQLYQKICFSGYPDLPTSDLRITRITYRMNPGTGLVLVDVEAVEEAVFSSTHNLGRTQLPNPLHTIRGIMDNELNTLNQNMVGTVTSIDGLEATVQTEQGTVVKARIVTE